MLLVTPFTLLSFLLLVLFAFVQITEPIARSTSDYSGCSNNCSRSLHSNTEMQRLQQPALTCPKGPPSVVQRAWNLRFQLGKCEELFFLVWAAKVSVDGFMLSNGRVVGSNGATKLDSVWLPNVVFRRLRLLPSAIEQTIPDSRCASIAAPRVGKPTRTSAVLHLPNRGRAA
ncbi:hypothetical protein N657DRAFT_40109 [Parathielavia appendiculata]|uniref:Secreted protein n=1 Tax=Parathielavia appendiculata TaxID=2587402 RepID=A0AAN6U9A2_9PEZI|nr:hypothetical protein N657DRAFT_40109 [Parathielavia appendiculata]